MNKAITVISEQMKAGIITLQQDGTFWKNAKVTNYGKIIPIVPKRMEVELKNGYLGVVVWKDGKQYLATAHRAAYLLLVGEIPPHMDINHKDGNKHNNNPSNLEVVTRSANLKHAYKTGLRKRTDYAKEYSTRAKALRHKGMSYSEIGKALGISQTAAFRASKL